MMNYIVTLFGVATFVAGLIIVINPETIFGLLRKKSDELILHILAVAVRIIIGIALIVVANESRYPTVILIIGWLSIAAATFFAIIGRAKFKRLMSWALSRSVFLGRVGGLLALLFGGFLVYAVI